MRNKSGGGRPVLFVHGATYPSEHVFDLPLGGRSWMDHLAGAGYDVWLMNVRGYGRSTRPSGNPPVATTEEALRDLDAVVEHIRKLRGADKVNLLGWSWGTAITQWYTSLHSSKVAKLALYAPLWIRESPSLLKAGTEAYRTVTPEQARARWLTGVAPDQQAALIPEGWFDAFAKAAFPDGSLQAPNGVITDGLRYWGAGVIPWKAEDIRVPVLLVRGAWDVDTTGPMAHALLAKLPQARYAEIPEGTHNLMMEKNRLALFREVQRFLDQKG